MRSIALTTLSACFSIFGQLAVLRTRFESCGLQGFVGSGDAGLLLRAARSLLLLQRQVIDRSLMSASVGRMLFQQRDEAVRFEAERECPGRKESALRS